jgi:hypothetical protein
MNDHRFDKESVVLVNLAFSVWSILCRKCNDQVQIGGFISSNDDFFICKSVDKLLSSLEQLILSRSYNCTFYRGVCSYNDTNYFN